MASITIETIQETLKPFGWKVTSTQYKNLDTEMTFVCNEGHEVYASWKKIRTKCECPVCKNNVFKEQDKKIIPKKKNEVRVIGLDQQTYTTGYSIFSDKKLIKYGTFETHLDNEIARDNAIKIWLLSLIENWQPDLIAIEGIQLQETSDQKRLMGVTVYETLARLQGILMETCFENKIPYVICPTNTWRAHCKVKGKTRTDKKRSAQLIIKDLYDITISDDESDAILIGKYASDTHSPVVEVINWEI